VWCIFSWCGNRREIDHWGDLGVDDWIIVGWMCGERGCIGSCWGNRRERNHWGDLGVDGLIILVFICGNMGFIGFGCETGGKETTGETSAYMGE